MKGTLAPIFATFLLCACGGSGSSPQTRPLPPVTPTPPSIIDDCGDTLQSSSCSIVPGTSLTLSIDNANDTDGVSFEVIQSGIYEIQAITDISIALQLLDTESDTILLSGPNTSLTNYGFITLETGHYHLLLTPQNASEGSYELLVTPAPDTDDDGLADRHEIILGTLVDYYDSDEDSLSDGDEVLRLKTSPLDPDSDADTFNDNEEVMLGTLPTDSRDFPRLQSWQNPSHLMLYGDQVPVTGGAFLPVNLPNVAPQIQWQISNTGNIESVLSEGELLITDNGDTLRAFQIRTGENLWQFDRRTDDPYRRDSVNLMFINREGIFLQTTSRGRVLSSYHQNSGRLGLAHAPRMSAALPDFQTVLQDAIEPIIDRFGDNLLNGFSMPLQIEESIFLRINHNLVKTDLQGNHIWSVPLNGFYQQAMVYKNQKLYVFDGELKVIDPDSGAIESAFTIDIAEQDPWQTYSLVAGSDNNLLLLVGEELLDYSLDSHSVVWQIEGVHQAPLIRYGEVYVKTENGIDVYAEDTKSLLWTWQPNPDAEHTNTVLTRSHLLYATVAGVEVINLNSRQLDYVLPNGGHVVVTNTGNLVVTGNDQLTVYDIAIDKDTDSLPDWWENLHNLNFLDDMDASSDEDGDSLSALLEYESYTDPNNRDSDQDSLSDGAEVQELLSNPNLPDSDADGLTDAEELATGSLITHSDSDNDGLPDGYEHQFELGILQNSAADDKDNDGLTNLQEYIAGSTPNNPDSDADGISDGNEQIHIPPSLTDSDNDTMPDTWELYFGLDPQSDDNSRTDSDSDGFLDFEEYFLNTNPLDSGSLPTSYGWRNVSANTERNRFIASQVKTDKVLKLDSIATSTDDQLLAEGDYLYQFNQQNIIAWRVSTQQKMWEQHAPETQRIEDVIISDAGLMASFCSSNESHVKVLQPGTGEEIYQIAGCLKGMSSRGNYLYASSDDPTSAPVYHLDGSVAFELSRSGELDEYSHSTVMANGQYVYNVSIYATKLYDAVTGELRHTLKHPAVHHVLDRRLVPDSRIYPMSIDSLGVLHSSVSNADVGSWYWFSSPFLEGNPNGAVERYQSDFNIVSSVYGKQIVTQFSYRDLVTELPENYLVINDLSEIVTTRNVIFAQTDKTRALDRETLEVLWETDIIGSMIYADNHLFINDGNEIHIFRFSDTN